MSTNDFFSKDVLCGIIKDNLDTLHKCIDGTIYQQWTAVILLMQFIEYLLKYKIQSAGQYKIQNDGKNFPRTHQIKVLYNNLTDEDRKDIEERFTKLMKDREIKEEKSFCSIKEFAKRYNNAYYYSWRYDIIDTNFESDEEYFYLADTFTVLHALIESTGLKIDASAIPNQDELAGKILKTDMRWGYAEK